MHRNLVYSLNLKMPSHSTLQDIFFRWHHSGSCSVWARGRSEAGQTSSSPQTSNHFSTCLGSRSMHWLVQMWNPLFSYFKTKLRGCEYNSWIPAHTHTHTHTQAHAHAHRKKLKDLYLSCISCIQQVFLKYLKMVAKEGQLLYSQFSILLAKCYAKKYSRMKMPISYLITWTSYSYVHIERKCSTFL